MMVQKVPNPHPIKRLRPTPCRFDSTGYAVPLIYKFLASPSLDLDHRNNALSIIDQP
jgi:hypothetical protein